MYKKIALICLLSMISGSHTKPSSWTVAKGYTLGTMVTLSGSVLATYYDDHSLGRLIAVGVLVAVGQACAEEYITTHDPVYQLDQAITRIKQHPLTVVVSDVISTIYLSGSSICGGVKTVSSTAEQLQEKISAYYRLHTQPYEKAYADMSTLQKELVQLLHEADILCKESYESLDSADEILQLHTTIKFYYDLYTTALTTLETI